MKQLSQQIRNELRHAHRRQRDYQYRADHGESAGLSRLHIGFALGMAEAYQERRQVLGYLHLALRKETR